MKNTAYQTILDNAPGLDEFTVTDDSPMRISYRREDETCYASFSVTEVKEGFIIRFHTTDQNRVKLFDVGGTLRGRTPDDLVAALQVVSQGLALLRAGSA